jgi:puromycin-sensitive aminopeptidase
VPDDPSLAHRLPRTVLPRRYELELDVDPARDEVPGRVGVEVEVVAGTATVELHAAGPRIGDATVVLDDGTEVAVTDVVERPDEERVVLHLAEPLATGATATLRLAFTATLGDQLVGLYRAHLGDGDDRVPLAVTQFESTHARRAFPCFDEPDLKATFALTLVVPEDLLAVANTAEVDRSATGDGTVRIRFADTIPMSTYLVALVVGPLEATEPRPVAGVAGTIPLRVVHPPGTGHLAGFALDVAEAALGTFEGYYGLPYPGDKLDLVAVPDFAFGAMENLGCVTFREVLLLVDPDRATRAELQRVADVVNHELAHMWFGDLVTMRWWEGIWLNEAFATFMEVMATDAFRPEWDAWTGFSLARAAAFDTDALPSTRPVEYPVGPPAEAEGMFDVLTYEKGASLVRMLEQFLGPERFRAGIAAYLRRHAYGNTATEDLWDALEEATGEPVRRIMDAWVRRPGHPVVDVERIPGGVRLSAAPMALLEEAPDPAGRPVPLVVTTSVAGRRAGPRPLLLEGTAELAVPGGAAVQVNTGADAFVRTALPPELRAALALDPATPAVERFVLLDDAWALVLAGRSSVADAVSLLRLLAWRESDPSVWRRISGVVRELRRLAGPDHADDVAALTRDLCGPAAGAGELALAALDDAAAGPWREVRGVVTSLLGTVGADPAVVAAAPALLDDAADADLRAAALDVVAANADTPAHEDLVRRWRDAATPQEQLRHLQALADTDDAERFALTLRLAVEEVRAQDAPYLLRRALAHHRHGGDALEVVTGRWDEVVARFPDSSLPRMLEGLRSLTDAVHAERARTFLAAHPVPTGARSVDQHLERMAVSVRAAARVRAELADDPAVLQPSSPPRSR